MRAGLRELLDRLGGVEVIAEARNGMEAVRLAAEHMPDVAVMDISMPELNGIDATARITRDLPEVRVIMLSMHVSEEYAVRALRAGASGYLAKSASLDEFELALKAVAEGKAYLSPEISRHVVDDYLRRAPQEVDQLAVLTERQRQVVQLVGEGHTTKEIARILEISQKTAETHRTEAMRRLNVHDTAGLVRWAVRTGLVSSER
jgi:DNA-binding NarL/FixJ family response regulator